MIALKIEINISWNTKLLDLIKMLVCENVSTRNSKYSSIWLNYNLKLISFFYILLKNFSFKFRKSNINKIWICLIIYNEERITKNKMNSFFKRYFMKNFNSLVPFFNNILKFKPKKKFIKIKFEFNAVIKLLSFILNQ